MVTILCKCGEVLFRDFCPMTKEIKSYSCPECDITISYGNFWKFKEQAEKYGKENPWIQWEARNLELSMK